MPVLIPANPEETESRVRQIIHQPSKVDSSVVDKGVEVDNIPENDVSNSFFHGELWVHNNTHELWYEKTAIEGSVVEFKRLFTKTERKDMRSAAKNDTDIEDFLDLLNSATSVKLDDPDIIDGLDHMVAQGLLDSGRKDEVLNGGA